MSKVDIDLAGEVNRLREIIDRARFFDGRQTVNGVTDRGYMSPDEWYVERVLEILDEVDS